MSLGSAVSNVSDSRPTFFKCFDIYKGNILVLFQNCPLFFLDNIFIRFGSKLYRQIVGFSLGTNCAPLVADLSGNERDFMLSLSNNNQTDIIEDFLTPPPAI